MPLWPGVARQHFRLSKCELVDPEQRVAELSGAFYVNDIFPDSGQRIVKRRCACTL